MESYRPPPDANGAAFDDAVQAARALPNLSIGCHIVLVDGAPVAPPGGLDTLLAIRSAEPGQFYSNLSAFAARHARGLRSRATGRRNHCPDQENSGSGNRVSHLDSLKHTHIFPEFSPPCCAARICGVRAIRSPFVPMKAIMAQQFAGKRTLLKRYGQVRVLIASPVRFGAIWNAPGCGRPTASLESSKPACSMPPFCGKL